MKLQLAFDINLELTAIERIASKYIPDNIHFVFTPGKRYPVIDKTKYTNSVLSKEPFMAYKCVPCVVVLLLKHVYHMTWDDRDLFESNPLLETNGENYIDKYYLDSDDGEIVEYFMSNISKKDKSKIIEEVQNLFATSGMFRHIANYKDHVFSMLHEDKILILNVEGHIKELRYQELLDNTIEEGEREWETR